MASTQISNMEESNDEPTAGTRSSPKKKAKKPLRTLLQDYEKREEALRLSHLESCGKQVLSVKPTNPNFTFSYAPRMVSESIPRTPRAALSQAAAAANVEEQQAGGGEGGQEAVAEQAPRASSAEGTAEGVASAPMTKQRQLLKDAQRERERVWLTRFGESKRVQRPVMLSTNASPFSCTYPYDEPRPSPPPPPAAAEDLPSTSTPAPIAKMHKYSQGFEAKQRFYLELQASPHVSKLRSFSARPAFSFGRSLVGCRQSGAQRAKSRKMDLEKLRDNVSPAELKVDWPSGL